MKQIALLRGINVSGKNKIKMEELKVLFEKLSFKEVKTYIQSGNVVFLSDEETSTNKENIKKGIKTEFLLDIETIVLLKEKLFRTISENPFDNELYDKKALYYAFLSSVPTNSLKEIESKCILEEKISLKDDVLYLYYPNGIGKSKVTNTLIESKLGVVSTIRNYNTVTKLLKMLDN